MPQPQSGFAAPQVEDRKVVLLSLNASALCGGAAIGASVGAAIVAAGHGPTTLCATAAGAELAALTALAAAARLRVTVGDGDKARTPVA